jgi:hypothetical protein
MRSGGFPGRVPPHRTGSRRRFAPGTRRGIQPIERKVLTGDQVDGATTDFSEYFLRAVSVEYQAGPSPPGDLTF